MCMSDSDCDNQKAWEREESWTVEPCFEANVMWTHASILKRGGEFQFPDRMKNLFKIQSFWPYTAPGKKAWLDHNELQILPVKTLFPLPTYEDSLHIWGSNVHHNVMMRICWPLRGDGIIAIKTSERASSPHLWRGHHHHFCFVSYWIKWGSNCGNKPGRDGSLGIYGSRAISFTRHKGVWYERDRGGKNKKSENHL